LRGYRYSGYRTSGAIPGAWGVMRSGKCVGGYQMWKTKPMLFPYGYAFYLMVKLLQVQVLG
jgi:hypothetical protein